MTLSRNEILGLVVFVLLFCSAAVLFAHEDNNNYTYYERYSSLPDYSENNEWDPRWVGKRSKDCYELNSSDCMKYSNCGLCIKNGTQKCIPGDHHGPLFKEGCQRWIHTDYRDRHIFGEKNMTITPPYDYAYPYYEAVYPSPQSRATLMY